MHKSCVHEVTSGTHVGHADDGSLVFTSPGAAPVKANACAFPAGVTHGSAWKAWAQHVPTGSENTVTFLNGSWPVPPGPSDPSGAQTLFYWNGLEPTDTSAVLQPVLQWGMWDRKGALRRALLPLATSSWRRPECSGWRQLLGLRFLVRLQPARVRFLAARGASAAVMFSAPPFLPTRARSLYPLDALSSASRPATLSMAS